MEIKKNYITTTLCLLSFSYSASSQQGIYAGYPISFEGEKNCTAGFVVKRFNSNN